MRSISSIAAVAAIAALGLLNASTDAFPRAGIGGGARGVVSAGSRAGFAAGRFAHGPARTGLAAGHWRHGSHRLRGGVWGWGWGGAFPGYGGIDPLAGIEPGYGPPVRDVPLVEYYNVDLYTGGPYGFPLGRYGYDGPVAPRGLAVLPRHACEAQNQIVAGTHREPHRVTIVRC